MKTRVSVFVQCVCMTILGFITAVPAQAGLMHNITPEQEYLDYADTFPYVGWLGTVENGVTTFRGSAVLIDPHWVLTAAHPVLSVDNNPTSFYDGYRVGFSSNFFQSPGENLFANAVYVNPDYQAVFNGPDLALLYFEDAFSVTPVDLYNGPQLVDQAYDFVGYGQSGTVSTGYQSVDGKRRAGTNLLTNVDVPEGYVRARFLSPAEPGFQQLGILAGPGDSGGAMTVDLGFGPQLAGIISGGTGSPSYGSLTVATYFSTQELTWIRETMQSHAVPEPSSMVLIGLGGLLAAPLRRRLS